MALVCVYTLSPMAGFPFIFSSLFATWRSNPVSEIPTVLARACVVWCVYCVCTHAVTDGRLSLQTFMLVPNLEAGLEHRLQASAGQGQAQDGPSRAPRDGMNWVWWHPLHTRGPAAAAGQSLRQVGASSPGWRAAGGEAAHDRAPSCLRSACSSGKLQRPAEAAGRNCVWGAVTGVGGLVYSLEQVGWHHGTGFQKADGEGHSARNDPSKNLL